MASGSSASTAVRSAGSEEVIAPPEKKASTRRPLQLLDNECVPDYNSSWVGALRFQPNQLNIEIWAPRPSVMQYSGWELLEGCR